MHAAPGHFRLVTKTREVTRPAVATQQIGVDQLDRNRTVDVGIVRFIDDAHGALTEQRLDAEATDLRGQGRVHDDAAGCSSSFSAATRLRRMRLKDCASEPISSRFDSSNSGTVRLPRLISSARREMRLAGTMIKECSITLSNTSITAKRIVSALMMRIRLVRAWAAATRSGTDTTCAPTMSPSFQPKPFCRP